MFGDIRQAIKEMVRVAKNSGCTNSDRRRRHVGEEAGYLARTLRCHDEQPQSLPPALCRHPLGGRGGVPITLGLEELVLTCSVFKRSVQGSQNEQQGVHERASRSAAPHSRRLVKAGPAFAQFLPAKRLPGNSIWCIIPTNTGCSTGGEQQWRWYRLTFRKVVLETERLVLRSWQESDLHDLFAYASVPGVGEMAGWLPSSNGRRFPGPF